MPDTFDIEDYATAAQRDALAAAIDTAARRQAARMYRRGTWDQLTDHDQHACRALVEDAVRVGWEARGGSCEDPCDRPGQHPVCLRGH